MYGWIDTPSIKAGMPYNNNDDDDNSEFFCHWKFLYKKPTPLYESPSG